MAGSDSSPGASDTGRPRSGASISIRTILAVAATVVASALVSVTDVALMIFVLVFCAADSPAC
jgi:hypothetical protein